MTPDQKQYYESQLVEIRSGGCEHSAFVRDCIFGMGSYNLGPIDPPVVAFGQNDDPYYTQWLQNWGEVDALIKQLEEEATKAWGARK